MTNKQYKNIVDMTRNEVKNEKNMDSATLARKIMNNCGVALPNGSVSDIAEALATEEYMGWRTCTAEQAIEYADDGTPVIGINANGVTVVVPNDETKREAVTANDSCVMYASELSAQKTANTQYYAYYANTTSTTTTPTKPPLVIYGIPKGNLSVGQEFEVNAINSKNESVDLKWTYDNDKFDTKDLYKYHAFFVRFTVQGIGTTTIKTTYGGRTYSYTFTVDDTVTNRDYRGQRILSVEDLEKIESYKRFYQKSADEYDIPWKMLAAVHCREHGLKKTGSGNGCSPYGGDGNYLEGVLLTDDQFQQATDEAAKTLKHKSNRRDLNINDNIKYTLFAYNGLADRYKTQALNLGFTQTQADNGEGSPYVMNRADARRDPTVEPTKSNNTWGQIIKKDKPMRYPANKGYGAYIIYTAI